LHLNGECMFFVEDFTKKPLPYQPSFYQSFLNPSKKQGSGSMALPEIPHL